MIVSKSNFDQHLKSLQGASRITIDTETTGLLPYKDDVLFSVIIKGNNLVYPLYFNFNQYPNLDENLLLDNRHVEGLSTLLTSPHKVLQFFNAPFDMAFLEKDGFKLSSNVYDAHPIARVLYNDYDNYTLDSCAKRIGYDKSDEVEKYITKNKLFTLVLDSTSGKAIKNKHYNEVPLEIIQPYAETDSVITEKLCEYQQSEIAKICASIPFNAPSIQNVFENEIKLTNVIYQMAKVGIQLDVEYCHEAIKYYTKQMEKSKSDFEKKAGPGFKDSAKYFSGVIPVSESEAVRTPKGSVSFGAKALPHYKSDLISDITAYRDSKKYIDFFNNFLFYADKNGVLHTNLNQGGTTSGRLSSSKPNLQNMTKDAPACEYPVRKALVPRQGFFFASLDYDQIEYRLMLLEAKAYQLLAQIKGGLDVHQAMANSIGETRDVAKTVNFAILYGSGLKKLSTMLGVSESQAVRIRDSVFKASPEISKFIYTCRREVEQTGFITNWFGRRNYISDKRFSYTAPNARIQGGAADISKISLNRLHEYLKDRESRLVLQIHDENIFEISYKEANIVPELKRIMDSVYQSELLPISCTPSYSLHNLSLKTEGYYAR